MPVDPKRILAVKMIGGCWSLGPPSGEAGSAHPVMATLIHAKSRNNE
jgi:hypothetical protein